MAEGPPPSGPASSGPARSLAAGGPAGARILVIKLGALGDFIQALGPMKAIREHHRGARVTLLTTAPFAELGLLSGYFDEVWVDRRPAAWNVPAWLRLGRRLRRGRFDRVYDLQTSDRSGAYYRLMRAPLGGGLPRGGPEWSGIARGCSHPHDNPDRDRMHTLERQAEQLARAGIERVPPADLSWLDADVALFALDAPYVLLVPGGARHRPAKRWPAESFAALARRLVEAGREPVVLGAAAEAPLAARIGEACGGVRDLTGATTLAHVAALARRAEAAVGNDTGPMHILAAVGCRCVALFSAESDPALCAPRGRAVTVLQRDRLRELGVDEVWAALDRLQGREPAAARP